LILNELLERSSHRLKDRTLLVTLASACFQRSTAWILAHGDHAVSEDDVQTYSTWVERIEREEPLAYVTGTIPFRDLEIKVDSRVLIPRPETELLVETALRLNLPDRATVFDLGTGSGCIAASLTSSRPHWRIFAGDRSLEALALARKNAAGVSLVAMDALTGLNRGSTFDLVISNPPYVVSAELPTLPRSVREYEPMIALDGGRDGLDFYRLLCHSIPPHLKPGGWIVMEIGYNQSEQVASLFCNAGWTIIEILKDGASIPRVVTATWLP